MAEGCKSLTSFYILQEVVKDELENGSVHIRMPAQTTGSQPSGPQLQYACESCGRKFSKKSGLGLHVRIAHPSQANATVQITRLKRRWTPEEVWLLAQMEAKATIDGLDNLNKFLFDQHTNRTFNAIKCQRRKNCYK